MFCFEITLGETINCIVLIITALLIWKYTKEAQKSNEIQERPGLNLYLEKTLQGKGAIRRLFLKNIGNGTAYNVKIEKIEAEKFCYFLYPKEPNPIIEVGGNKYYLSMYVSTPTGGREMFNWSDGFQRFMERLFPHDTPVNKRDNYQKTRGMILISYEGLNGKSYYSVFRIYSSLKWPFTPEVFPDNDNNYMVEFINSGKGNLKVHEAKKLCASKKVILDPVYNSDP